MEVYTKRYCHRALETAVADFRCRSKALKLVKQLFLDFDVNNDCTLDLEEMVSYHMCS